MELNEIAVPQESKKIYWVRMILCAVTLCAALALIYGVYVGKGLEIIALLEGEKEMPNGAWFLEKCFVISPAFLTVFVVESFYLNKNKYVSVFTRIEKLIVLCLGAIAVFAVVLPLAVNSTPVEIVAEDTTELKNLWDRTYEWFFAQIVPFLILISYHALRASAEGGKYSLAEDDGDDDAEDEEND